MRKAPKVGPKKAQQRCKEWNQKDGQKTENVAAAAARYNVFVLLQRMDSSRSILVKTAEEQKCGCGKSLNNLRNCLSSPFSELNIRITEKVGHRKGAMQTYLNK